MSQLISAAVRRFTALLASTAVGAGAALVGCISDVAGAVSRTVLDKLRERRTPEDFGAVGDGDGIGGGTNDAASLQAALDWVRNTGGKLKFSKPFYRCDSALTLLRSDNAHAKQLHIDGNGSVIDFKNMAEGTALKIGATAQAYFIEQGSISVTDLIVTGPETADPRTEVPAGSTVGIELSFAGNVTLTNVQAYGFFKNWRSIFAFPVKAINCNGRRGWIGLHLDEVSNDQDWDGFTAPNCRYPILVRSESTALDAGKTNNVTFRRPWVEGSSVGPVIDSGTGGAGAVRMRSIAFYDPYLALVTYDHFRIGRAWTLNNPETRNGNCSEFINDVRIVDGLWNPAGGAWSAAQAAVCFDTATRVRHFFMDAPVSAKIVNANTFVGAPAGGVVRTREYPGLGTDGVVDEVLYDNGGSVVRRLNRNGDVMLGSQKANSQTISETGIEIRNNGSAWLTAEAAAVLHVNRKTETGSSVIFYQASSVVGSISVTGAATAYNTSSDYRLKRDVQPVSAEACAAAVMSWPLRSYEFRAMPGVRYVGVLAHELQAVAPHAVTGAKDAVDEEGRILPQGVDYSKLVPELAAAFQWLLSQPEMAAIRGRL